MSYLFGGRDVIGYDSSSSYDILSATLLTRHHSQVTSTSQLGICVLEPTESNEHHDRSSPTDMQDVISRALNQSVKGRTSKFKLEQPFPDNYDNAKTLNQINIDVQKELISQKRKILQQDTTTPAAYVGLGKRPLLQIPPTNNAKRIRTAMECNSSSTIPVAVKCMGRSPMEQNEQNGVDNINKRIKSNTFRSPDLDDDDDDDDYTIDHQYGNGRTNNVMMTSSQESKKESDNLVLLPLRNKGMSLKSQLPIYQSKYNNVNPYSSMKFNNSANDDVKLMKSKLNAFLTTRLSSPESNKIDFLSPIVTLSSTVPSTSSTVALPRSGLTMVFTSMNVASTTGSLTSSTNNILPTVNTSAFNFSLPPPKINESTSSSERIFNFGANSVETTSTAVTVNCAFNFTDSNKSITPQLAVPSLQNDLTTTTFDSFSNPIPPAQRKLTFAARRRKRYFF